MDRHFLRCRCLAAVLVVAVALLSAAGCQKALFTAMYLINGPTVPADFDGLREHRVAVVCRPLVELQYRNSNAAKDIARQIGILLRANGREIEVIDQQKVADWIDQAPSYDYEYSELGKALEAEMVVAVDLEQFRIYLDQTLYQGKADATIKVYDLTAEGNPIVFEKILPQVVYPPNTGIPTSAKPEAEFRRRFVQVLADQIGRHFYPHDPHADFAQDATALH